MIKRQKLIVILNIIQLILIIIILFTKEFNLIYLYISVVVTLNLILTMLTSNKTVKKNVIGNNNSNCFQSVSIGGSCKDNVIIQSMTSKGKKK